MVGAGLSRCARTRRCCIAQRGFSMDAPTVISLMSPTSATPTPSARPLPPISGPSGVWAWVPTTRRCRMPASSCAAPSVFTVGGVGSPVPPACAMDLEPSHAYFTTPSKSGNVFCACHLQPRCRARWRASVEASFTRLEERIQVSGSGFANFSNVRIVSGLIATGTRRSFRLRRCRRTIRTIRCSRPTPIISPARPAERRALLPTSRTGEIGHAGLDPLWWPICQRHSILAGTGRAACALQPVQAQVRGDAVS